MGPLGLSHKKKNGCENCNHVTKIYTWLQLRKKRQYGDKKIVEATKNYSCFNRHGCGLYSNKALLSVSQISVTATVFFFLHEAPPLYQLLLMLIQSVISWCNAPSTDIISDRQRVNPGMHITRFILFENFDKILCKCIISSLVKSTTLSENISCLFIEKPGWCGCGPVWAWQRLIWPLEASAAESNGVSR